jgi:hypothetical protein
MSACSLGLKESAGILTGKFLKEVEFATSISTNVNLNIKCTLIFDTFHGGSTIHQMHDIPLFVIST